VTVEVSGHGESDTTVTILSDVAELSSQIDAERARLAKERLEAKVRDSGSKEALAALRRAEVRLEAAGHPSLV
jgi:F0F1-type ATP synthase epsilon subunit